MRLDNTAAFSASEWKTPAPWFRFPVRYGRAGFRRGGRQDAVL